MPSRSLQTVNKVKEVKTDDRPQQTTTLKGLPNEIFDLIIASYVDSVGLYPAWGTRGVDRMLTQPPRLQYFTEDRQDHFKLPSCTMSYIACRLRASSNRRTATVSRRKPIPFSTPFW
jgi:hypothetical protein